jgi:hypothetical protein
MHKNNPFQRYNYFSNEHYTSNSKQTNILIQIGMLMKGNNMPPGGVGSSSSPTGGAVVGRGGRPSPEMLRGSGALPMRESDSGSPPRRESNSFCLCGQRELTPATVASFGQRNSFLRRRWQQQRRLYVALQEGAGASGSGGARSGHERRRQDEDVNGFQAVRR